MVSDRPHDHPNPGQPNPGQRPDEPSFSRELYGIAVIGLAAWIGAMVLLPERLERYSRMQRLERELAETVETLRSDERKQQAAILAMENDPFYREEAYRYVLGVKKKDEEFLQKPPVNFR